MQIPSWPFILSPLSDTPLYSSVLKLNRVLNAILDDKPGCYLAPSDVTYQPYSKEQFISDVLRGKLKVGTLEIYRAAIRCGYPERPDLKLHSLLPLNRCYLGDDALVCMAIENRDLHVFQYIQNRSPGAGMQHVKGFLLLDVSYGGSSCPFTSCIMAYLKAHSLSWNRPELSFCVKCRDSAINLDLMAYNPNGNR